MDEPIARKIIKIRTHDPQRFARNEARLTEKAGPLGYR